MIGTLRLLRACVPCLARRPELGERNCGRAVGHRRGRYRRRRVAGGRAASGGGGCSCGSGSGSGGEPIEKPVPTDEAGNEGVGDAGPYSGTEQYGSTAMELVNLLWMEWDGWDGCGLPAVGRKDGRRGLRWDNGPGWLS
ncbi:hypothetical protein PLESTB_000100900 [Pleodorina starrii]|uniref:Uncharacterized protein n=1 Tax=Pleodorina starrii TaxID=330485 RepID=A0A9W6EXP3_9CHLO|nr:hypothetical protein PLESTM_000097400 [Pleodorina starrii]GLC48465.1 hypothetical protein PLESTB_000100900 [Pleodorina starrii]GLC71785.1 hypothetical protein PLESTF_001166700 [Pleodorina starrii]